MRKHPTLLLLSAAALLLTTTPTFGQTGGSLSEVVIMWRNIHYMYQNMMDTEKRTCQLPDPDAVQTLLGGFTGLEDQAQAVMGTDPVVTRRQRAETIANEAHAWKEALVAPDSPLNQLPDSCSS
jgi:hypothetical protein